MDIPVAKVMKMTAEDLYELGMIERIICEDEPATDDNIEEQIELLRSSGRYVEVLNPSLGKGAAV